ncbi:MAG: DNA polymerase III subunit gamma/tau [Candidatus Nanosyncoccaceae bacterium]|jgi:DNA polymerase-3 subunit gamma/tau
MPALYRKYRSVSFAEVIGQPQVTDVLEASLKQNRIAHGYLFVGPHGVGKTSVARILAFAIIGEKYSAEKKHIDVIEIDAASNTGVDNIRELIDKAQIAPSLAKKKVYIIDEVHMLSKSAFNALLKLLEEPPRHVVFILATTEEHKVLSTIVSRMQKFVFRRVSDDLIAEHLTKIAKDEKIKISKSAIKTIANFADGSVRDAISLFDQLSSLTKNKQAIDETTVRQILGLADQTTLNQVLNAYITGNSKEIAAGLQQLKMQNITAGEIALQLAKNAQEKLSKQPSLIDLITKLIDVPKSPVPELALTVATYPINVMLPEKTDANKDNKLKEEVKEIKKKAVKTKVTNSKANIAFDWDEFISTINKKAKPIASYLQAASYKIDNDRLTIVVRNTFQKKTLDNPARLKKLHAILADINCPDLKIETIVDEKVMKINGKISDVIQLMGGGEEVVIDDKI